MMKTSGQINLNVWLLIAIIAIRILWEFTGSTLLEWAILFLSVWLFLNLYWLGFWFILHLNDSPKTDQSAAPEQDAQSLPEAERFQPYRPSIAAKQMQILRQSKQE